MDDRIARIVFEINSTAFDDDCQPAISMMTAQRLIEDHVKIVRAEALREAAGRALKFIESCNQADKAWAWVNLRAAILDDKQEEPQ